MNSTTIVTAAITLIIGAGAGYALNMGKASEDVGMTKKQVQDSIVMMRGQSAAIETMSKMMIDAGTMMQEKSMMNKSAGMMMHDDAMMQKGKDLKVLGEKYMADNKAMSESSDEMKKTMSN